MRASMQLRSRRHAMHAGKISQSPPPPTHAPLHPRRCRIRGISFVDLLYVSQNSMTQFKTTVTEGFSRLWDEVRKQKDELMAKMGAVGRKQNQLIESQSQMDERLRQVRKEP